MQNVSQCSFCCLRGSAIYLSADANRLGEVLKDSHGILPVNAGIGDADTGLETGGSFGRNFLVALVDVGLDHDTNDGLFTFTELVANDLGNLGLVLVVFLRVAYCVPC